MKLTLGGSSAASGRSLEYSRHMDTQKVTDNPRLSAVLDALFVDLGVGVQSGENRRGLSDAGIGERAGSEQASTSPPSPLSSLTNT